MVSQYFGKKIGYAAMVLSGLLLLAQSTSSLLLENNGSLSSNSKNKGFETKLKWQNTNFALEFTYSEGFEFEQMISISELIEENKKLVYAKKGQADKIIIEAVYSISHKSYEAYYFREGRLINKFDFK